MSMASATLHKTSDFVIQGPTLIRGNKVLEAIHALYYLPENFKLVFTGSNHVDQSFFKEALLLVERDELIGRVEFEGEADHTNAVIVDANESAGRNRIAGDSPEAMASAILKIARFS